MRRALVQWSVLAKKSTICIGDTFFSGQTLFSGVSSDKSSKSPKYPNTLSEVSIGIGTFLIRNRAPHVLKPLFWRKSFENDVVIAPELLVKFPDGRKDEAIDGEQHQW